MRPAAVIDWERLRAQGVHPSFSLPSSHSAVRSQVSPSSLRDVCAKHPQDAFRQLCDREAVIVPMMLNHPDRRKLDHQVYRAHLDCSSRCVRTPSTPRTPSMAVPLSTGASPTRLPTNEDVNAELSFSEALKQPVPSFESSSRELGQTWQSLVELLEPRPVSAMHSTPRAESGVPPRFPELRSRRGPLQGLTPRRRY